MAEVLMFQKSEMLTITQVARRFNVSSQTIRNYIESGKLKAFRYGFSKKLYIPLKSVKELEVGVLYGD